MTAGLNKVMLIGNLGDDPIMRYSQQGTAVLNFSLATNEKWTNKSSGEPVQKTEWHRVVVFGKQAEICEKYLRKGSALYAEGRLQTRNWEKEGQTHYVTEIVVNNFQFLGGRPQSNGGTQNSNRIPEGGDHSWPSKPDHMSGIPPEDDIPF